MGDPLHVRIKSISEALAGGDSDALIACLTFYDDEECQEIKTTIRRNPWILTKVCELGFAECLQSILDFAVLDMAECGQEGLQSACRGGHVDIVDLLLIYGALINQNVWEEDAEFYIATLYGHDHLVDKLYSMFPQFVGDESVRYCLFFAACKGGHIQLLHKWMCANTDVNKEIEYVSNLQACEYQYPLFAACSGQHYEVARYLILDLHASITKEICQHFPDFTRALVQSTFLRSDDRRNQSFLMSDLNIVCVLPCWFHNSMNIDESDHDSDDEGELDVKPTVWIDLSRNKLTSVPDEIMWQLKRLVHLNLCFNPLRKVFTAISSTSLQNKSLTYLNLSHCELEYVCQHIFLLGNLEELNLSYNELKTLTEDGEEDIKWKCGHLHTLDISHNFLTSLPIAMRECTSLTHLAASHNRLEATCPPWQCPMHTLDLSHNLLSSFSPSSDQFWGSTLRRLIVHHNQLDELPKSIVEMTQLTHLDASDNKILKLPLPRIWKCPLLMLNLDNNNLGTQKVYTEMQRVMSLKASSSHLEFPGEKLKNSMQELYIANNNLKHLPDGICDMVGLSVLHLGQNVMMKTLPKEIGRLKKLLVLRMEGIQLDDKELQSLITLANDRTNCDVHVNDVVKYQENLLRNCKKPDIIKMVVLGCKNLGGHCIVEKITKSKNKDREGFCSHEEMAVTSWCTTLRGEKRFLMTSKRNISFEIWEFPVTQSTPAILPCFLTPNSLYLITHDTTTCEDDMQATYEIISSIQATVIRPFILLVCIYQNSMEKSLLEIIKLSIQEYVEKNFSLTRCIFLPFHGGNSSNILHRSIQEIVEEMQDSSYERKRCLLDRKVPATFIDTMKNVKSLVHKDICTLEELLIGIGCTEMDLEDHVDSRLKMHDFLLQTGTMLNYNIQMQDLSSLVILNPRWLFGLLSSVLNNKQRRPAQVLVSTLKREVELKLPLGYNCFPAILCLFEVFHIGIRILNNSNKEVLLLPSLLPSEPPTLDMISPIGCYKASRLYPLPFVPAGLWSHILAQLTAAFGRFSSAGWKFEEGITPSSLKGGSVLFRRTVNSFRRRKAEGLSIRNKNIQYWREGVLIIYDEGCVLVRQMEYCNSASGEKTKHGILIYVQTNETQGSGERSEEDQRLDHLKKLAVIGIVRDEIEEVLEQFLPKFQDPSVTDFMPYALCPHCSNIQMNSSCHDFDELHFPVKQCAQMMLWDDFIYCTSGPVPLDVLIPELFFLELPSGFLISFEDIQLCEENLGQGLAGSVVKGIYRGHDVAIKIFHASAVKPLPTDPNKYLYPNMKILHESEATQMREQDQNDTEQIKIVNAFTEVRREVRILSKLKHRFIIPFIGLCIRPYLLIVMELAPLGSLRAELNRRIAHQPDHTETDLGLLITTTTFSKDLTYKIILQIASGLSYLHNNNIIFRDLKPDNILLMSLDINASANVKLADYGISKFTSLQGISGLQGTVGYMAPEVMKQQAYTNMIDIYSFGIVMFEILTGIPPLADGEGVLVSQMRNSETCTPEHIKNCKLHCNFPWLDMLIPECLSNRADERPRADKIVKRMKHKQFLLLHDLVWMKREPLNSDITCVYACETSSRWNIWICESNQAGEIRYLSVYDVESSCYAVSRQQSEGCPIIAMAKVGHKIITASMGSRNLEIIVRGNQHKFEIQPYTYVVDADPTRLLSCTDEDGQECILVGLQNGSVTCFHCKAMQGKSVTTITTIEIQQNIPITSLCYMKEQVIAVGSGTKVSFIKVMHNYSKMGNTESVELSICREFNFNDVYANQSYIASIIFNDSSLWCSFQKKNFIFELHSDLAKILNVFSLNWDPVRDHVTFQKVKSFANVSKKIPLNAKEPQVSPRGTLSPIFENSTGKNLRPPPIPPRRYNIPGSDKESTSDVSCGSVLPHDDLAITSLALSKDVLIVGTNCGGLLSLPLVDFEVSVSSPIQFPVLRHPSKLREEWKFSSINNSQNEDAVKTSVSSGRISSIILANEKLVTLYKMKADVSLRSTISNDKLLKEDKVPINLETHPLVSIREDTADIAIWDTISKGRLDSIMLYGDV